MGLRALFNPTSKIKNMQVFVPYPSPIDTAIAMSNDKLRLRKQIIECDQILKAISGESKAWKNHPVVKMYAERPYNVRWLLHYRDCLQQYLWGNEGWAYQASIRAEEFRPPFLTDDFGDQHKRRLYTKAPELYPQFAEYGKSEENWYFVEGRLRRYVNGKEVYGAPWLLDMQPDGSPVEDLKQICERI